MIALESHGWQLLYSDGTYCTYIVALTCLIPNLVLAYNQDISHFNAAKAVQSYINHTPGPTAFAVGSWVQNVVLKMSIPLEGRQRYRSRFSFIENTKLPLMLTR
ncbi:hypothetical protein [Arachidicoccus sp.]|uniref:hypothetical protein n=1 Tax=Arachidicoccus sp. TaxID=1872624 RepID=UPI003D203CF7